MVYILSALMFRSFGGFSEASEHLCKRLSQHIRSCFCVRFAEVFMTFYVQTHKKSFSKQCKRAQVQLQEVMRVIIYLIVTEHQSEVSSDRRSCGTRNADYSHVSLLLGRK